MTNKEAESCIQTIEMLRKWKLKNNPLGVMNVIDADNCEKIIKVLHDIPKYKDAYAIGYNDGVKATNVDCGVVWEERIDAIKAEIMALETQYPIDDNTPYISSQSVWKIINKHCGGENE